MHPPFSTNTHAESNYDALLRVKDAKAGAVPAVQWAPCSQMAAGESIKDLFAPSENSARSTKQKAKEPRMLDLDLAFYGAAEPRPLVRARANSLVRRHSATNALTPTPAMAINRRTTSVNDLKTPATDSPKVPKLDPFIDLLKHARAHTKRKVEDMGNAAERKGPSKVPATATSTAARGCPKGKGKASFVRTRSESSFIGEYLEQPMRPTSGLSAPDCADLPTPSKPFSSPTQANGSQHSSASSAPATRQTGKSGSQASTQYISWSQTQVKLHPVLVNPSPGIKQKPPEPISVPRSAAAVSPPSNLAKPRTKPPALGMRPRATHTLTKTGGNQKGFKPPIVEQPLPPPAPAPPSVRSKAESQPEENDDTDSDTTYDFDTSFDMETLESVMKQYE